ncbi:MAG: hypothetical protein H7Y86_04680 [Rhizobacter sp.]|nr:hypothetical protein [Ferruginibacter sp.]
MLEELFNLVKENAKEPIVDSDDIPNDQNDAVVAEATNTVASGLRNMVAGGGLQNIISMFTGGGQQQGPESKSGLMSNPIVSMMIGHFAGKLMSKYNIGGQQANNVSSNLIPQVISGLISKTNDPGNNGFSLEGLLNSITGGKVNEVAQNSGGGFDIGSLISQFTGGGQQNAGGGGGGLMDIVSQFTQGAQQQQQKNGGGGLMDLIQGFLKK